MTDIIVKINLIIFKDPERWLTIRDRLIEEYGQARIIISWRLRQEFGFSVREHRGLEPHSKDFLDLLGDEWKHRYHYQEQIHLDFFNNAAQSWFQLKYL